MDILEKGLSVLKPLEIILNKTMDFLANSLGIKFPEITLPSLPSLGFLDTAFKIVPELFERMFTQASGELNNLIVPQLEAFQEALFDFELPTICSNEPTLFPTALPSELPSEMPVESPSSSSAFTTSLFDFN
jgi:hypothetical protein